MQAVYSRNVVGVSLTEKGHPQYAFWKVVEALKHESVLEILKRFSIFRAWYTETSFPHCPDHVCFQNE